MAQLDLDRLKKELTPEEVIKIIQYFVPELRYETYPTFIMLPTVCHNEYSEVASMKLYYYFNTNLFHCYTECDGSFDIYELVKKMLELRSLPSNFYEVLNVITRFTDVEFTMTQKYTSVLEKYEERGTSIEFKEHDPKVLGMFHKLYYGPWIDEGISYKSMDKYGVRFSIAKNQVIIPHWDMDGALIGIRVRNLDRIEILKGNKYMPARIEGQWYSHPVSYTLYGLHQTRYQIAGTKTAFLFEGEKSVMKCDSWYGDSNIAVATCGNRINKFQIGLLQELGVQNVVICYDKMDHEDYFYQLTAQAEKYKQYMNFSFIYDRGNKLDNKEAPVDKGQEIFEELLKERVIV